MLLVAAVDVEDLKHDVLFGLHFLEDRTHWDIFSDCLGPFVIILLSDITLVVEAVFVVLGVPVNLRQFAFTNRWECGPYKRDLSISWRILGPIRDRGRRELNGVADCQNLDGSTLCTTGSLIVHGYIDGATHGH